VRVLGTPYILLLHARGDERNHASLSGKRERGGEKRGKGHEDFTSLTKSEEKKKKKPDYSIVV